MNTWTDWCLALREITEDFASKGELRGIYLWLSQSHYTRLLTAWYPICPSARWLRLLSTLSFSLSPKLFLNLLTDSPSIRCLCPSDVSWGKVSATFTPSFHHVSPPSFLPHFQSCQEWRLRAVTVHKPLRPRYDAPNDVGSGGESRRETDWDLMGESNLQRSEMALLWPTVQSKYHFKKMHHKENHSAQVWQPRKLLSISFQQRRAAL